MKTKTRFGLVIIGALALCLAVSQPLMASDEEEVLQVATDWTKAFSNGAFELMSSLYLHSPKTSEFSPVTGYPFLYQGWDLLEAEWKSSLTTIPKGALSFSIHNPQVTLVGKDVAVTAAYLTPVFTDPETKEQTVDQIRLTLVLQKVNGKWLIVHEHSSGFPTE